MSDGVDPLALFGTEEQQPARQTLRAGPLSAILEEGNLRTIRYGGIEVLRAINYLARDSSWGTYRAELSNLTIEESAGAFSVGYDGLCAGPEGRYAYRMKISGEASGRLVMEADGEGLTDFPTNRTGFVVLHPSEAAGGRLAIRHSDGRIEETVFPEAISPDQPAFDIAALTHQPAPGLVCTVAMDGDAFEMEDQRNWADASFKTYVRPLSKPRPYTIAKGERDLQRIMVAIEGRVSASVELTPRPARLTLGGPVGRMPSLALFVEPEDLSAAIASADRLGPVNQVIVRLDVRRSDGHEVLASAKRFARAVGAALAVEAIFDARDPAAEAASLAARFHHAEVEPTAVLVSPRREFKTRPSSSLPAGERPIGELVDAIRRTGVASRIGAGTPSFFTEFNRNPPSGDFDFVFFSIASNVHAADDASVVETLSVYPAIIASARKLCPGTPLWLGPCTIAMRHNPYGAALASNPSGARNPGSGSDPRHGALFGAAFAAGIAAAAAAEVEVLVLAAPTGRFGLLDDELRPRPVRPVHAILSAAAGAQRLDVSGSQTELAVIGFDDDGSSRILLANLAPRPTIVRLPTRPRSSSLVSQAGELRQADAAKVVELPPYGTMLLEFPR